MVNTAENDANDLTQTEEEGKVTDFDLKDDTFQEQWMQLQSNTLLINNTPKSADTAENNQYWLYDRQQYTDEE